MEEVGYWGWTSKGDLASYPFLFYLLVHHKVSNLCLTDLSFLHLSTDAESEDSRTENQNC